MLGPVSLPGREGVYELELVDGLIRTIRPSSSTRGRLALPAFADLHVHADRAFARGPRAPRSLADAIDLVGEIKRSCTVKIVQQRAELLLGRALQHGSQRVRTHVDIDELGGDNPLQGVVAARETFAGRLDLEIVAFATAHTDPASEEGERRLRAALEQGADLLGAVPAFHPDPEASVAKILDLAVEYGVGIDFHLDEHLDPTRFQLERLADEVVAHGLQGRVTSSHCCALASVDRTVARRTIEKVRTAGITVISLPATNLYLEDRSTSTPRARGLTLVQELVEAGVPVRFGSDNVGDVFYPYGDADPLESAWLAALAAQVDDEDVLLAGICDGRTRVEEGDPADLVVLEADSFRDALARRPAGRTAVRAGAVVSGG